jgi:hypothetical protein
MGKFANRFAWALFLGKGRDKVIVSTRPPRF